MKDLRPFIDTSITCAIAELEYIMFSLTCCEPREAAAYEIMMYYLEPLVKRLEQRTGVSREEYVSREVSRYELMDYHKKKHQSETIQIDATSP